ncbi:MAG: hypothetical protein ACUVRJ_05330 [Candidatus Villigracilaceae bacterium]
MIFTAGILIGILFVGGASWADYEASLFDADNGADGILWSVHCPVMIAPHETGTARAVIKNELNRQRIRRVQTHISAGFVTLMEEYLQTLELAPDEARSLEWEFSAQNAAWRRFVLVRVTLFGNYPSPSRTGSCGVQVVNFFGLPGKVVTLLACCLSWLLVFAGILLRKRSESLNHRPESYSLMFAFAGLLLIGMISVLPGLWLLGALSTLGIFLLGLVGAAHAINTKT